jgi:hypothetical protein
MKWREFKKHLEEQGVKDDDEILHIEVFVENIKEVHVEKIKTGWLIHDW